MILYVVHGNTYFDSYGYEEHIFGVYTKKKILRKPFVILL